MVNKNIFNRGLVLSLIVMFFVVIMANSVSAFEFDNVKSYNPITKEVIITNAFGLGSEIGKIKLNTPLDYHVGLGYQKVAEFSLQAYQDYDNILKELNFYDKKFKDWESKEFVREYDFKYRSYENLIINDYEVQCETPIIKEIVKGETKIIGETNTTQICENVLIGNHTEQKEVWEKLDVTNLKKDDYLTIGIFTDVKYKDKVEWIPSIYGVRIEEWAEWTADLNVGLINYYKLDEQDTTGTGTIIDAVGNTNGVNEGTSNISGAINTAYYTNSKVNRINLGDAVDRTTNGDFAVSMWFKGSSSTGLMLLGNYDGGTYNTGDYQIMYNCGSAGDNKVVEHIGWGSSQGFQYKSAGTHTNYCDNNWHHLVVMLDRSETNSQAKVYIDNSSITMTRDDGSDITTQTMFNIGGSIYAGWRGSAAENYDNMDEIAIYNRTLNIAEISLLSEGIQYTTDFNSINISLNSPEDNLKSNLSNINFQCNTSSTENIINLSLIIDNSIIITNSTSGRLNLTIDFNQILSDGNHNWTCNGNNINNLTETPSERFLEVDTTSPIITINKPLNQTYTFSELDYYNVTTNELVDTCYFELDSTEYNMTTSDNLTWTRTNNISQSTGNHTVLFTCKDNVDNIGYNSTEYNLQYVTLNSPVDNLLINDTSVTFNVSVSTISGNDVSNVSLYNNESGSWDISQSYNNTYGINITQTGSTICSGAQCGSSGNVFDNNLSTGIELQPDDYVGKNFTNNVNMTKMISKIFSYGGVTVNLDVYDGSWTTLWTKLNVEPAEINETILNNSYSAIRLRCTGSDPCYFSEMTIFGEINNSEVLFYNDITDNLFWNVEACYDDGNCYFAENNDTLLTNKDLPSIIITSPIISYNILSNGQSIDLNVTSITNGTLDICKYEYNNINSTINCNVNTTFNYIANINNLTYCVNDTLGNEICDIREWVVKILEINQSYNNETTEGNLEDYLATIILSPGYSVDSAILVYDGSNNIGQSFSSGDNIILRKTDFSVPNVATNQNLSFYWSLVLSDLTIINLTTQNQTVYSLGLDNCSSFTNELLNFTVVDEEQQTILPNATIEIAVNIYDSSQTNLILNHSNKYVGVNPLAICMNINLSNSSVYSMDVIVRYEDTENANEYYNIVNSTLNNESETQNIILYDLNLTDSTDFQLTFTGSDFLPVENALVYVERQYIGEDKFKTVELPKTDYNGETVLHLVRNKLIYNIIITKDGVVLGNFENLVAFCDDFTIGDCNIELNAFDSVEKVFSYDDDLGITYTNPEYNGTENTISFNFLTTDGTTKLVNLSVSRNDIFSNRSICNSSLISSGGTLTCSIDPNIDESTLKTEIYVSNVLTVVDSVDLDSSNYGDGGYLIIFVMAISLVLMFSGSKTGVLISLGLTFVGSLGLNLMNGDLYGVGVSGIWLIVIILLGIYKLNKDRNP